MIGKPVVLLAFLPISVFQIISIHDLSQIKQWAFDMTHKLKNLLVRDSLSLSRTGVASSTQIVIDDRSIFDLYFRREN